MARAVRSRVTLAKCQRCHSRWWFTAGGRSYTTYGGHKCPDCGSKDANFGDVMEPASWRKEEREVGVGQQQG